MKTGIVLLNFGEPARPERQAVLDYLQRIFVANADLDDPPSEAEVRRRSRELAERRLPGLLEEYREINGSPLNAQARGQARALQRELTRRGVDAMSFVGMQFTEPAISGAVEEARRDDVDVLVGLPVYPLCGRSTTVAALDALDAAVRDCGWDVQRVDLTGWHRHPDYLDLRADNIRRYCREHGLDPSEPDTALVFSAHGTPVKYLDGGVRYDEYVAECCREVAARLEDAAYVVGFQNHGNRRIEWTEPEIDDVIREVRAARVLVEPVSFMHEQSETLSELDVELREVAEDAGIEFHRVPVPHDDERFIALLADLVEASLTVRGAPGEVRWSRNGGSEIRLAPCRCRSRGDSLCLNAVDQASLQTKRAGTATG